MNCLRKNLEAFPLLNFTLILLTCLGVEGKKCPGKCIGHASKCTAMGGKVIGYCTNGRACCDDTWIQPGSCGATISNLTAAIFHSPDYPDPSRGDLICTFEFVLNPAASGVLVDFTEVLMDGVGVIKNSPCESDVFYFKGFPGWTPPALCGSLENYTVVIDLGNDATKGMTSFKILALMSGKVYKWSMKIFQIIEGKVDKVHPTDNYENELLDLIPPLVDTKTALEEGMESHKLLQKFSSNGNMSVVGHKTSSQLNGHGEPEPEDDPFIINGEPIDISETPWQASLRWIPSAEMGKLTEPNCSLKKMYHFCGGSIISERHILSAAHCFASGNMHRTWKSLSAIKVVLGASNLCDDMEKAEEYLIDKIYFHYAYDNHLLMNDIVVIKLKKKIQFTNTIQKIELAEEGMDFSHVEALVSGWGDTNDTIVNPEESAPEQLQVARGVFIGNLTECIEKGEKYGEIITQDIVAEFPKYSHAFHSVICTYVWNTTVPKVVGGGDSGGPLVAQSSRREGLAVPLKKPLQIGVVSLTKTIRNPKKPHDVSKYIDVYTSVPFYRKWIRVAMHQQ